MKKFADWSLLLLFLATIFIVPLASKLQPKEEYSPFENRNLATRPSFSKEKVLDGSYMKEWETYFSDHFIGRNALLSSYVTLSLQILHKPVVSDVVVRGDTLLPYMPYGVLKPQKLDEKIKFTVKELTELNRHISSYGGRFLFVGVPGQFSVMREEYPFYLNSTGESLDYVEKRFFPALKENGVLCLDMYEKLQDVPDYKSLYSKVDHHYNFKGAFFTYEKIIEMLDIEGLKAEDMEFKTVGLQFYGSRNRKLYKAFFSDEKLMYGVPKNPVPFTRYDNGTEVEATVFRLPKAGQTYATYGDYMGGDFAETIIKTDRPELKNALIFGDSFTNPLEGLLYASFNETRALDLRYYTKMSLWEYIDAYKPDIVICVRDDSVYLQTEGNGKYR